MPAHKNLLDILRRRTSFRFPLELPAVLRWEEEGAARTTASITKNISSTGLYVMVDKEQRPASTVAFEVGLPARSKQASGLLLRGSARLVRCEELGENRVGLAATVSKIELCGAPRGKSSFSLRGSRSRHAARKTTPAR